MFALTFKKYLVSFCLDKHGYFTWIDLQYVLLILKFSFLLTILVLGGGVFGPPTSLFYVAQIRSGIQFIVITMITLPQQYHSWREVNKSILKTSIDFVSFVQLISNMHHSIAFDE